MGQLESESDVHIDRDFDLFGLSKKRHFQLFYVACLAFDVKGFAICHIIAKAKFAATGGFHFDGFAIGHYRFNGFDLGWRFFGLQFNGLGIVVHKTITYFSHIEINPGQFALLALGDFYLDLLGLQVGAADKGDRSGNLDFSRSLCRQVVSTDRQCDRFAIVRDVGHEPEIGINGFEGITGRILDRETIIFGALQLDDRLAWQICD